MEYFDDLNFNLGINFDLDFSLDDKRGTIQKPEQQHGINDIKFNSFFENFYKVPMELGLNQYDIPCTNPFIGDLSGCEYVAFGEKAGISDPSNTVIHFYIDDYKFESVWRSPYKYLDLFKSCRAVITPDFSNYTDMPKALHIYNHYRRQWCGMFWQNYGINVISSLSWGCGMLEDYSIAGIPQGTTVATSFVGDTIDVDKGIEELKIVLEKLNPHRLLIKTSDATAKILDKHFEYEAIESYRW